MIILPSFVGAVGFSPSSLVFNLNPGERECKNITINSESETITAEDRWAENKDIEWKVSNFDTSGSSHGISISYPNQLSLDEREVEVCLSGSNLGEYRGVLLLKEEQQGNSIIQMGIWLKVIIGTLSQSSSTSSSTSTGSSTASENKVATGNLQQLSAENENVDLNPEAESNKITGGAVGSNSHTGRNIIIILITCVIIAGTFLFIRRKKE